MDLGAICQEAVTHQGSEAKGSACNAEDLGFIPASGRSPGERNGYPIQCSCLEYPMNRRAWQARVHGVTKSRTRLSDYHFSLSPQAYSKACFISIDEKKIPGSSPTSSFLFQGLPSPPSFLPSFLPLHSIPAIMAPRGWCEDASIRSLPPSLYNRQYPISQSSAKPWANEPLSTNIPTEGQLC